MAVEEAGAGSEEVLPEVVAVVDEVGAPCEDI